jgi:hypothetical protein
MTFLSAVSTFSNHLLHPFTISSSGNQANDSEFLSPEEKKNARIAAAVGILFFGIGSPIAFYAVTAYYKCNHIRPNNPSVVRTSQLSIPIINSTPTNLTETEKKTQPLNKQIQHPNKQRVPLVEEEEERQIQLAIKASELEGAAGRPEDPKFNEFLDRTFNIHPIKADGNCCAYAMVTALNPNLLKTDDAQREQIQQQLAKELRDELVEHMKTNKTEYMESCTIIKGSEDPLESYWKEFVKVDGDYMSDKHSWQSFVLERIRNAPTDLEKALLESNFEEFIKTWPTDKEMKKELQKRHTLEEKDVTFEDYLATMKRDGIFFGPQEIKAFAEVKQRPVIICKAESVSQYDLGEPHLNDNFYFGRDFANPEEGHEPIYLHHKDQNHYELLTLKEGVKNPFKNLQKLQ